MNIIAYTYEADVHCIDCTENTFGETFAKMRGLSDYFLPDDREGNRVHPLFSIDEWQEFDASFLADNPIQYLACGDCHKVIDEYKHEPIKEVRYGI